ATWPVPPRRGPTAAWPVPPRRGPTAAWPHRGVAPLRPGTSSVEFGGFGGRDTPATAPLDPARRRGGAPSEADPAATPPHTRPATPPDPPQDARPPAPHTRRHQKRRASTLEAAPQSMRRAVCLRGGQLTSGRGSLGRPEVLEGQVVDGQVRLAPAAELLGADPRGIGRLGGGELQA